MVIGNIPLYNCFRPYGAMHLEFESNLFELVKQCFRPCRAVLWKLWSYALDVTEQCSIRYGAMLCKVRSSALDKPHPTSPVGRGVQGSRAAVTSLAFRAPRLRDSTASVDDLRFKSASHFKLQYHFSPRKIEMTIHYSSSWITDCKSDGYKNE